MTPAALASFIALLPLCCPDDPVVGTPGGAGEAGGAGAGQTLAAVTVLDVAPRAADATGPALALVGRVDGRLAWALVDLEGLGGDAARPATEEAGRLAGAVVAIAFAPDGAAFVLDDGGALARVARGAEPAPVARHEGGGLALAVSQDGAQVATGGQDGVVRVWTAGGGALAALEGHEGPVAALCWSDDQLWSAGWDGTVRAWAPRGRRLEARGRPLSLGTRELSALARGPEGGVLVGGFDGALALVDAERRRRTAWAERPHQELVRALAASPDGTRALAVCPGEAVVLLLDLTRPGDAAGLRRVVSPADGKPPSAVAFLPGGQAALVGRFDGTLSRVALPAPGGPR